MSAKCVACIVSEDPTVTPVRAAILVVGLIKTNSLAKVEGQLCARHRRTLDSALAGSTAMLRKLMS